MAVLWQHSSTGPTAAAAMRVTGLPVDLDLALHMSCAQVALRVRLADDSPSHGQTASSAWILTLLNVRLNASCLRLTASLCKGSRPAEMHCLPLLVERQPGVKRYNKRGRTGLMSTGWMQQLSETADRALTCTRVGPIDATQYSHTPYADSAPQGGILAWIWMQHAAKLITSVDLGILARQRSIHRPVRSQADVHQMVRCQLACISGAQIRCCSKNVFQKHPLS